MTENNAQNDSKFSFKDKQNAEETLKLLESHNMEYRKLTVRGLLMRAKRVLTITKCEEKLRNISEAIEVFQKWLDENVVEKSANKNNKSKDGDKVETVPGLGFKDKKSAEATLSILKDRDPEYQKFAIKGLLNSAQRVLLATKNEEKIQSIQEGKQILEDFLAKFETENMMKNQRNYLEYDIIRQLPEATDALQKQFLLAYGGAKAKGNYKHLRTMFPENVDQSESISWDIIRNRKIAEILAETPLEGSEQLFDEHTGKLSDLHMKLIHWAYSPKPDKVKAYVESLQKNNKLGEKRAHQECPITTDEVTVEDDDQEDQPATKRVKVL